ncbi:20152_t:CDS:2, partial [Racocetra persica]
HELHPEQCKYSAKFRLIGREALIDIEFYTKNGNLSITIQCQLFRAKYPNATFLDTDLANAIQHYKIKPKDLKTNASQLLSFLIERRSLCELLKTLDSRLEKEAKWNRFFEYKTLSSCVGIASIGSEVLSAVDHILSEYLTSQILSIERIEIAQYLYFDVILANLTTLIRLDGENEITTNNLRAAAQHSKFDEIWGLAWQAVQLAVECEDNEMEQWLKSFINQKKHFLVQNKEPEDSEKENNSTIAATEKGHRQPYTCRICGKTGHNSARCQEK